VIHDKDTPCQDCPLAKIMTGSIVEERNFKQGNRVYEVIHSPVRGPRGEVQKLAVCRDITEHKEAFQKLTNVNRQLDSFAHTVSHDLRSPLTGVSCYTELIKEKYAEALKGDGIEMLEAVEKQAKRMLSIIEDMLCFSTAEHVEATNTPVNTNEIVKQILLDNRFEIEKKQVLLKIGDLPKLKIPEALLYEMIGNLLLNAVRYGCQPGGTVEVAGSTEGKLSSISVIDHGPGIPAQERDSVFDVFVRGSTAGSVQGTGIGLATVSKIVERFDGKLFLVETPGGGCTFKVMLPFDLDP
jgi:signal transduction histidine kinase